MATINGTTGNDTLNGTSGDDTINGDAGDDTIDGGDGNDTINGGDGRDFIHGGAGDDVIHAGDTSNLTFPESIWDDAGNDTVYGEGGQDFFHGSAGDDYYDGGTGGTQSFEGDSISYSDALAAIRVDMRLADHQVTSRNPDADAGIGTDTLVNMEGVTGSAFNDVMIAGNTGMALRGGDGNDLLTGGSGSDILTGDAGDDTLDGGAGDDQLSGDDGNDTITDGAGSDTVNAGAGSFDSIHVSVDHANDVFDGGDGTHDLIYFTDALAGVDANLSTGVAQSIAGGADAGIGVDQLVNVEGLYGSTFDDVLTGDSGNNDLIGREGDDILNGGAGNDVLSGFSGDDVLNGGDGTDRASYANGTSGVVVSLAISGAQNTGQGIDTLSSIEDLVGTPYADVLTGNDVANWIDGWEGNDRIFGGGSADNLNGDLGDDYLDGGSGVDQMSGGEGNDTYVVDNLDDFITEISGQGTDTVLSSVRYGLDLNVENLTLTGSANIDGFGNGDANVIKGNSGANDLVGNGGNDKLTGFAGNDTLDGGVGADVMRGGVGDDTYYVDNVGDRPIENAGEGTDTVHSSINYALAGNIENLNLSGSAIRASGNSLDNRLVGTDGANIIDGGAGADVMRGGLGDDRYYIDNVGDRAIEGADAGRDRVYTTVSLALDSNLEDLFARGSDAINLTGNSLDNVLRGNSAANILTGGAGADDLRGGTGADTFVFRDGDFAGLTPSTSDRIIDFSHSEGDRIDLRQVDANSGLDGTQHFSFIGSDSFHDVAGELRYEIINGNTYVYGDTNGDGLADLMIRLDGSHALTSGDFIVG